MTDISAALARELDSTSEPEPAAITIDIYAKEDAPPIELPRASFRRLRG